MTVAFLSMFFLALCLLGALCLQHKAHDRERRELIDRITVPEAAVTAAFHRAVPMPPAPPDTDREDDAAFGRLLDDDFLEVT